MSQNRKIIMRELNALSRKYSVFVDLLECAVLLSRHKLTLKKTTL